MFGSQQELIITSSGHYAVPLGQRARMDKIKKGDLKVMLVAKAICIKACVRYFLSMFIFSSSNRPSKTMKNVFYFILKALFVFEIFKFLYFRLPLFFYLPAIALDVDPRKSFSL